MKISSNPEDQLVTHALGSCLGIAVYDPVARVGGMLHVMLPLSSTDPEKAKRCPYMFVDTGVPRLFLGCYKAGAKKERLQVKVAGGACIHCNENNDFFQIGKRNFVVLRKILWQNGIMLTAHDVGGNECRTLSLDIGTGEVTVKSNGQLRAL
jgi:chemotaxis protein CheD